MSKGRRGAKGRAARQRNTGPGWVRTEAQHAGTPPRPSQPARKNTKRTAPAPSTFRRLRIPIIAGVVVVALAAVATFAGIGPLDGILNAGGTPAPVRWAALGTQDAHALAFVNSKDRLVFGHHEGVLQSRDGGRTWQPTGARDDAMAAAPANDGSIVIAGHHLFRSSRDDGATWQDIQSNLPALDIHGFARDPVDGNRMWAYLESAGVFESTDGGSTFQQVRADGVGLLTGARGESGVRLLALDQTRRIISSVDGGRTWTTLGQPPAASIGALATSGDGRIVLAGTAQGLYRSDDGGTTWSKTTFGLEPYSIAMSDDGQTIAVVDENRDFYRSDDGGATWPGPTTAGN